MPPEKARPATWGSRPGLEDLRGQRKIGALTNENPHRAQGQRPPERQLDALARKSGRPPIKKRALTPAERQQHRRKRLATEKLSVSELEQDAIGSYYAGIPEIAKRVRAGEPVPAFLLPKRAALP